MTKCKVCKKRPWVEHEKGTLEWYRVACRCRKVTPWTIFLDVAKDDWKAIAKCEAQPRTEIAE